MYPNSMKIQAVDLAEAVFGQSFVSKHTSFATQHGEIHLLSNCGETIRLGHFMPFTSQTGALPSEEYEDGMEFPLLSSRFVSCFSPQDPTLPDLGINESEGRLLYADQEEIEERIKAFAFWVEAFEHQICPGEDNLVFPTKPLEMTPSDLRRWMDLLSVKKKGLLVDFVALQLLSLSRREDPDDYLIFDTAAASGDEDDFEGYVQFKSGGASGYLFGESESRQYRDSRGAVTDDQFEANSEALGWRTDSRIPNHFGVFELPTLHCFALLGELVVDTLVLMHGLTPKGALRSNLHHFSGPSLSAAVRLLH